MSQSPWQYSQDLQAYYRHDKTRNLLVTEHGRYYRLGADGKAEPIVVPPTSQPGRESTSQPRTPYPNSTSAGSSGQNTLQPSDSSAPTRPARATSGLAREPNANDRPREPLGSERQQPAGSRDPPLSTRGLVRGSDSNMRTLSTTRPATYGIEPYATTGSTSKAPPDGQAFPSGSKVTYPVPLTSKEQQGYNEHRPAASGRDRRRPDGSNNPSDPDVIAQSTDSIDSEERDLRARFSRYRQNLLDKGAPQGTAERLAQEAVRKDIAELSRRRQLANETSEPPRRPQLPSENLEPSRRLLPGSAQPSTATGLEDRFRQISMNPAASLLQPNPQRTAASISTRQPNPVAGSSRRPNESSRQPSRQPEPPASSSTRAISREEKLQNMLEALMRRGYTREDAVKLARTRMLEAAKSAQS